MKTPEEIKKGLECCTAECDACGECPYPMEWGCRIKLMEDAFTRIHLLETDNSCLNNTIRCLTELLNAAYEETAKVKRERDAAVDTLRGDCRECLHFHSSGFKEPCASCIHWRDYRHMSKSKWKWRGVCPENTEVKDDD